LNIQGSKTAGKPPKAVKPVTSSFLPENMTMILQKARIRNTRVAFGPYPGSVQGESSPAIQLEKLSANIKNARLSNDNTGIRINNLSFLWKDWLDLRDAEFDFMSDVESRPSLAVRALTKCSSLNVSLNTPVYRVSC
jgi:hypothetical protein